MGYDVGVTISHQWIQFIDLLVISLQYWTFYLNSSYSMNFQYRADIINSPVSEQSVKSRTMLMRRNRLESISKRHMNTVHMNTVGIQKLDITGFYAFANIFMTYFPT